MINKFKNLFRGRPDYTVKPSKHESKKLCQYTFLLTKDGTGKSIKINSTDAESAAKELKAMFPDYDIQFLWEWN